MSNYQLTKREQIAVAAMKALISSAEGARALPSVYAGSIAEASLKYAEAMMLAFERNPSTVQEDEDAHGD